MQARISVITLSVLDLEASLRFTVTDWVFPVKELWGRV